MKYQITTLLPLLLIVLSVVYQTQANESKHCGVKHAHKSSHKHGSNRHHKSHSADHESSKHHAHKSEKHKSSKHDSSKHDSSKHKSSKHDSSKHKSSKHKSTSSTKSGSTNNDSTSSSNSTTSTSSGKLTPNGKKAGLAGGDSLDKMKGSISWLTTWTPNPYPGTDLGDVQFASMAWGIGKTNHDNDAARWEEFKKIKHGKYPFVIGFNEADFQGQGSSGVMTTSDAANAWDTYIAPHGAAGSVLISPSCAKQQDETWLGPFLKAVKTQPDVINVHIFKNKASDIKTDLDHFAKYGKPMWITEMACIDYSSGTAYCNQQETNDFINEAIKILEADSRVAAYAWSDAYNGPQEKLTNGNSLSSTGTLLKKVMASFSKRDEMVQRRSPIL